MAGVPRSLCSFLLRMSSYSTLLRFSEGGTRPITASGNSPQPNMDEQAELLYRARMRKAFRRRAQASSVLTEHSIGKVRLHHQPRARE
jgi:hypothetical protein